MSLYADIPGMVRYGQRYGSGVRVRVRMYGTPNRVRVRTRTFSMPGPSDGRTHAGNAIPVPCREMCP